MPCRAGGDTPQRRDVLALGARRSEPRSERSESPSSATAAAEPAAAPHASALSRPKCAGHGAGNRHAGRQTPGRKECTRSFQTGFAAVMRRELDVGIPAAGHRDEIAVERDLVAASRADDDARHPLAAARTRHTAPEIRRVALSGGDARDRVRRQLAARVDQATTSAPARTRSADGRRAIVVVGEDDARLRPGTTPKRLM